MVGWKQALGTKGNGHVDSTQASHDGRPYRDYDLRQNEIVEDVDWAI